MRVARASASATVCVDNPGFFTALDAALADTPIDTLRDYLRWQLVRDVRALTCAPAFADEAFDFYGRMLGGQQEHAAALEARHWTRAGADIGDTVAQRLRRTRRSRARPRHRCEEMVDHLLSAMRRAIRDAEWMTAPRAPRRSTKLAGVRRTRSAIPTSGATTPPSTIDARLVLREPDAPRRLRVRARSSPSSASRSTAPSGRMPPTCQRLLPPAAQRDRLPGRHPAAAVLRRRRRRRRELRRHRHGHRPRDHPRLRRPGQPVRRRRATAQLVDRRRTAPSSSGGRRARRAVRRATRSSTTCTSTAGSRWARTSPTSAA